MSIKLNNFRNYVANIGDNMNKLTDDQIRQILKALLGHATEDFGDNLEKEFGIRAVQESNETIRKYRDILFSE